MTAIPKDVPGDFSHTQSGTGVLLQVEGDPRDGDTIRFQQSGTP